MTEAQARRGTKVTMWMRKKLLGIWEVSHKRGDLGPDLETHMTCIVS